MIQKAVIRQPEYELNEAVKLPDFPIHIFPVNIQNLLLSLQKIAQFELQITSSTLLFVVSTLIGNRTKIEVKKTWIDTPNIWVAIIGKPGTMKTPSMSFILMPLKKAETEFNKTFQIDIHDWLNIPKKEREDHNKPKRRQRYSNDPTVEGLISAMVHNTNGMGIYKDELNGFFEEMNRYNSGGNKEFYMSAFSGGQYIKNRASYDPITIDNIFLSIIGSIQPELLRNLSVINVSNGMIDRWLYVESNNTVPMFSDSDIPESYITDYMEYFDEIERFEIADKLTWEQPAKDYFFESINNIGLIIQDETTDDKLGTYLAKMRTYYARFIVIICAMWKTNTISIEFVKAAEDLTEYYINTAKNTFINFSNENEIDIIFNRNNAETKREKVELLLKHFPEMSKSKIAEKCKLSRVMVYKIIKNRKNEL